MATGRGTFKKATRGGGPSRAPLTPSPGRPSPPSPPPRPSRHAESVRHRRQSTAARHLTTPAAPPPARWASRERRGRPPLVWPCGHLIHQPNVPPQRRRPRRLAAADGGRRRGRALRRRRFERQPRLQRRCATSGHAHALTDAARLDKPSVGAARASTAAVTHAAQKGSTALPTLRRSRHGACQHISEGGGGCRPSHPRRLGLIEASQPLPAGRAQRHGCALPTNPPSLAGDLRGGTPNATGDEPPASAPTHQRWQVARRRPKKRRRSPSRRPPPQTLDRQTPSSSTGTTLIISKA